ncbi:MAG TPA: dihydroneopterin aldolase [Burkholderiales bacterium]|jgi:dihydroneopterin aldolase|nr:dihydroneopterin aldolase [Burkholderiales bacterium]
MPDALTAAPLFSAMDIIFIRDFRLQILIGIYEWERRVPQTVQFDLEIAIPPKQGPRTDRIGETIDYSKVVKRIEETLRTQHFLLLERLSEHVAQLVLNEFGAPWVKVSVNKIGALRSVKQLGVTIERGKRP